MINQTFLTTILYVGAFWNLTTALGALVVALILATAIMLYKRSKLKSVHHQRTACNYTRPGSFRLDVKRDDFLFANTTRVPIPQNNSGGGSRRRR